MSVVPPSSPRLSRRPSRPLLARGNSFSRQLVSATSRAPIPPSLVHSPYLEDPHSIFNGGGPGWRYDKRLTPPNEHDKLCLMDTVPIVPSSSSSPMNSRSSSSNSTSSNTSSSSSTAYYPSQPPYTSSSSGGAGGNRMAVSRSQYSAASHPTAAAGSTTPTPATQSGSTPVRSAANSMQRTAQQSVYTPQKRTTW